MEKFNVNDDCTEGLAEKLRAIKSVEVSFIAKQVAPKATKISMRSEKIDVASVCAKFGGGGHKLAAGALIQSPIKETVNKVLHEVNNSVL